MQQKLKIIKVNLLVVIIVCCFGCKKNEKKEQIPLENFRIEEMPQTPIDSSKNITIVGKTDDPYAFKYLNFIGLPNNSLFEKSETKKLIKDSLFLTISSIENPQLMDLMAFTEKKDTIPYYTRVFFTPGDSVFMSVKDGKIKFTGDNQSQYNFFLHMNDPLRQNWAVYKNDPYKYKEELYSSYLKKDSIFKQYIDQNPEVSEDFKNIVGSELKFEYLYNLILPRNVNDKQIEGNYRNNQQSMMHVYALNNTNNEKLFDPDAYYKGISIEDFKRPDLINNNYFQRSLTRYIRYVFANHDYLEFSRRNFINEKEFIQSNLDGELEMLAIGGLISDYFNNGFGHGEQDSELLKNLIVEYKNKFTKPSSVRVINEILDDIEDFNFLLPNELLNEKLLAFSGDTTSLNDILNKATNKTKVIDFWASWCGPCIVEFKKAIEFKKRIAREEHVEFLYFSVDKDKESWVNAVLNEKDDVPVEHQYLIINQKKSKLLKKMLHRENSNESYFAIPRYGILDSKNRIVSSNAPKPSDSLIFEKMIKEVKQKE